MTENDKYRNEHYPYLYPCRNGCKHWRAVFPGSHTPNASKMCHYCIDTGRPKDEEPDLINKKCKYYEKGEGSRRRISPVIKVSKR